MGCKMVGEPSPLNGRRNVDTGCIRGVSGVAVGCKTPAPEGEMFLRRAMIMGCK